MLKKAQAIQQRLIEGDPGKVAYRKSLAEIINVLGFVYYKRLDHSAALQSFQQVHDLCQALLQGVTAGPKPERYLDLLGLSLYNIASIQIEQKQFETALQSLEESLKYRINLVEVHSSVMRHRESLAETYRELAHVQHLVHQDARANSSLEKALELFQSLAHEQPDHTDYHSQLGRTWNLVGVILDEARKNEQAIPPLQRALAEQKQAVDRSQGDDQYKVELLFHYDNLGEQYLDLGRVAEALPCFKDAIEIRRKLCAAHSGNREYAFDLARALGTLGTILRHVGQFSAAHDLFGEARGILEDLSRTARDDDVAQGQSATANIGEFASQWAPLCLPIASSWLGVTLLGEAATLTDQGQPEKALPLVQQAVDALGGSPQTGGQAIQDRGWLTEALWEQACLFRALNRPDDAARADAQRIVLWQKRPPSELAALALKETARANLVGYGKTPLPDSAKPVRERELELAATNLRLAISQGFKDLHMLEAHPDSPVLLSRPDLDSVIKNLRSTNAEPKP
jgi:tetratricopeptide (TPR) repeat protein